MEIRAGGGSLSLERGGGPAIWQIRAGGGIKTFAIRRGVCVFFLE